MRIFYASDSSPNPAFESNLWRNNLYAPLVDLGHDVVEFEYDRLRETFLNVFEDDPKQKAFVEENRPRLTAELLRQIKLAHAVEPVDLFFSYFYDVCVLPEAIDEIRRMGITTVNWYCNGSYQLHLVSRIAPHYDWCLVPEKFRLKDYIAMGARPIYCQEAANPNIYKPYDLPLEYDVAFVGQAYGERPEYIRHLIDSGVNVHVWGQGWSQFTPENVRSRQRPLLNRVGHVGKLLTTSEGRRRVVKRSLETFGRGAGGGTSRGRGADASLPTSPNVLLPSANVGAPLSDVEMIKMYSRARINLGFSTCGDTHRSEERILQIRLRDFEVPMSGGFYMVEYMEELEEFFRVGEEVVCYTDKEDLTDKIRYYLAHDSERDRVRRRGYDRCRRDHTWHNRFRAAFREMGLSAELGTNSRSVIDAPKHVAAEST